MGGGERRYMKTIEQIFEDGTTSYCSPTHAAKMYAEGNCPFSSVEIAIRDAMREYAREHLFAYLKFREQYQKIERARYMDDCLMNFGGMFYGWTGASDEVIYEEFSRKLNGLPTKQEQLPPIMPYKETESFLKAKKVYEEIDALDLKTVEDKVKTTHTLCEKNGITLGDLILYEQHLRSTSGDPSTPLQPAQ